MALSPSLVLILCATGAFGGNAEYHATGLASGADGALGLQNFTMDVTEPPTTSAR